VEDVEGGATKNDVSRGHEPIEMRHLEIGDEAAPHQQQEKSMTNGSTWFLFHVLAMVSIGSIARAESSATRQAQPPSPKATTVARASSSADPFEDATMPTKPAAAPAAPAPPKPEAKPAAPPSQNVPSKEMHAFMRGLEGSWKCDTTFPMGALYPGSQPLSTKTDITIRKEPGGFSWHGEFRLAKTVTTAATNGMFQIGYASGIKQATYLSYDSVGTAMMGQGALSGDSVTFAEEGFLKGAKVKVRETLAAKGPRKLFHKVEIEQSGGFQAVSEDICSK
jgi:hypothetical protein